MTQSATPPVRGGSASIEQPDYWWYVARSKLLRTVLEEYVGSPQAVLDVGSADGPSVSWMHSHDGLHVTLDIDPRGLVRGGVCGSALALPFMDGAFDLVSAFDVIEHLEPEADALAELARVLAPGGRLLLSVPAYEWAWSDFDETNGHHRRYTRARAVAAVEKAGLSVTRSTYAFGGVFPFFAAERLARRVATRFSRKRTEAADIVPLPQLPAWMSRIFLNLSAMDQKLLDKRDLPFGSSVVVAAVKA
jgi:SAM-dependent methyltransferase